MTNSIIDFPFNFLNVTTDALVKTGAGVLHTVVLNGVTTVGDIVKM